MTSPTEWFERVYPLISKVSPLAPEEEVQRERDMLYREMFPDHKADIAEVLRLKAEKVKLRETMSRQIDDLVAWRDTYRSEGNWKEADKIRDLLAKSGVDIQDGKGTSTWKWNR